MHDVATFSHLNHHDTIICRQQIWNRYSVELSIMVWGEWIVWCFHLKPEHTSLKLFVLTSKTLWKCIIRLGFFEKMGINKMIKSDKINERRHVKKNPLIEHGNQTYHQFHLYTTILARHKWWIKWHILLVKLQTLKNSKLCP